MTDVAMEQEPLKVPGSRVAVLGGGASGCAAAALAVKLGAAQVELWDSAPAETLPPMPEGVVLRGGMPESAGGMLAMAPDICVVSPGVPVDSPLHEYAAATGAVMAGELEFAAAFCTIPMIGVTGTNGKTTTTELLTACINASGHKAVAAGNIGLPLSQVVSDGCDAEYIVLEVSSFQLEHCARLRLAAGALLNVTPDHLNRHHGFANYLAIKASLARLIQPGGAIVMPSGLCSEVAIPPEVNRRVLWFNEEKYGPVEGDWCVTPAGAAERVAGEWSVRYPRNRLQMRGNHNIANLCAVAAILQALGLPLERCQAAICGFRCGEHRIQLVATVNGVEYFDDSKATDVDALIQALRTLGPGSGRRILLIAGGLDKGCTLEEVKPELRMYVKAAFLIGQCRGRLAEEWADSIQELSCCETIEAAVAEAAAAAKPGDLVLLSPGCASMDMFRNYEERGDRFAAAAKALDA